MFTQTGKRVARSALMIASLILWTGCTSKENLPDTGGGNGNGEVGVGKTLNGSWRGVFQTKNASEPSKSHQASFDFTQEGTFTLVFQEGDKPKATGNWEDGGDALLLRVRESTILPEFPPESFVKLSYKVRGKTLTLAGDDAGAFMLTRQDDTTTTTGATPTAPTGPFGWWRGTDQAGVIWGIQIDEGGTFWAQIGDLIMRGTSTRNGPDEVDMQVQEAGDDGLIGRRLILQLSGGKAVLAVLKRNAASIADVSEAIPMERSGQ